jgi:hypothetical protein
MLPVSIDIRTLKGDPEKLGAIYEGQGNPSETKNIGDELSPNKYNRWLVNPYWGAYQFTWDDTRHRLIGQVRARYNITDELYTQLRVGQDWQTRRRTDIIPYGTYCRYTGDMNEWEINIQEVNYEWMAGYQNAWNRFGFNAFVGGNAMRFTYEHLQLHADNFNIPYFHTISNGGATSQDFNYVAKGINSLFGSLELSWGGYLYLTATARNDWFSTLDPSRNSILYPSVGFSWVFSDLFTMPTWWNVGKLRSSWAQVGGDVDPYTIDLSYGLIDGGHRGSALGTVSQNRNPNKYLVPLTLAELEAGIELGFFDHRVGLDVSVYKQRSTNDIVPATIPMSSGFSSTWINVGEMQNKGFEILLNARPVRKTFIWDLQLNYAQNRSKVINISDEAEIDRYEPDYWTYGQSRTRRAFIQFWEGHPYSTIVGFRQKKINGEGVLDRDTGYPVCSDSLEILGEGIHPHIGGITNTFSFKGFQLGFLVDFKFGGSIHSGTNHVMTSQGFHKQTLEGRQTGLISHGVDINGEWVSVVVPKEDLQYYWNRYTQITEHFVYDASFVKLRQVTLGYSFPESLLKKTPFTSLNVSLVGRNLALLYSQIENVDPESYYNSTNYRGLEYNTVPPSRSYGFNVNVKF